MFNGNGYSAEWVKEAKRRGLPNITNTVDSLAMMTDKAYVDIFERFGVFTQAEIESRKEIYLETYSKQINIEAGIMVEMAKRLIVPASTRYMQEILNSVASQSELGLEPTAQKALISDLSEHINATLTITDNLEKKMLEAHAMDGDTLAQAENYRSVVIPVMDNLREHVDTLERLTDKAYWPYPSYEDMLFHL